MIVFIINKFCQIDMFYYQKFVVTILTFFFEKFQRHFETQNQNNFKQKINTN